MKSKTLLNMGIPSGEPLRLAQRLIRDAISEGMSKTDIKVLLERLSDAPEEYLDHATFGELARVIAPVQYRYTERRETAGWKQWGEDLDEGAIEQMRNACRLPITVSGALMPDAHRGYGLPIGGVLATENAVIPYAVGVDIACRMKLSILDMPAHAVTSQKGRLTNILEDKTRFGIGARFSTAHDHEVMDEDWNLSSLTRKLRPKAQAQLGTSGSGNHFVEFGVVTLDKDDLGLSAGTYFALLSHSGSRGPGSAIAMHYSKLAMQLHPDLPKALRHLAWLDLTSHEGAEYWASMELMGLFASANHAVIHREIIKALKCKTLAQVENHHNFAWKERHAGRDVIVHRKGATPADKGTLGIIPGSMATPGYVVRGRGLPESLNSAAHGAGRNLSRRAAHSTLTWSSVKKELEHKGITLLSAGLDEAPAVYKDIHTVMAHQTELVDIVARFNPKIVKMAPAGERPED